MGLCALFGSGVSSSLCSFGQGAYAVELCTRLSQLCEKMVEGGADVNAVDENGKPALAFGAENGHTEVYALAGGSPRTILSFPIHP